MDRLGAGRDRRAARCGIGGAAELLTTTSKAGTADAISDSSICCNLTSIAAGTRDGKHLVRVRGDGRDCNGGTADATTDLYYEWKGTSLTTVLDRLTSTH
ncbi:MAG: hypothetical protein H7138_02970 [Myxococcales bacterium]|nr:hypothetical protein [Myxococcales bacterium]